MDEQTYVITFDQASAADASGYANELREALLDVSPDIKVELRQDNDLAMDFGATLVLILGTPAVVAAVQVIGNWLQLRYGASITVKDSNGEIKIQNITGQNAAKLGLFRKLDDAGGK